MDELLQNLRKLLPEVSFQSSEAFFWSPQTNTVNYTLGASHPEWTLLHETAHALLGHSGYSCDLELLLLEVIAWEKAKELAASYAVAIDEDHIQDCLDTYRDWLHRRSTCPTCHTVSTQVSQHEYHCYNCGARWQVSKSRFCRPYRSVSKKKALTTKG
jgi:hypothetical protein